MKEIILAIIGSSAFSALITSLANYFINQKKESNAVIEALKFNTLDIIERLGDKYIIKGEITIKEKDKFDEIYNTYKALNGDGYADAYKEEVNKLKKII